MKLFAAARAYLDAARNLSVHSQQPFTSTVAKMVMGRLRFQRGPVEFDRYRFADKPVGEWRGYAVERELRALQREVAPEEFRALDEDKLLFARRCRETGIATVPIWAFITSPERASGVGADVPVATSADHLQRILAPRGDFDGFAKPLMGGVGYGVFAFSTKSGRVDLPTGVGTVADLFEYCATGAFGRSGYLLQPHLRPHPDLLGVMPGPGLGTVRILSFLCANGELEIPWACLKMPAPHAVCDNLRTGSLVASVDMATGRLGTAVGSTPQRPVVHEVLQHPVTGARFTDLTLPCWPEARALIEAAARAFPELPALGWDVAITPGGPLLVETNWMFNILPEMTLNRGLADETRRLYSRVKGS